MALKPESGFLLFWDGLGWDMEQEETKRKVISFGAGGRRIWIPCGVALGWSPPGFKLGPCHPTFECTLL